MKRAPKWEFDQSTLSDKAKCLSRGDIFVMLQSKSKRIKGCAGRGTLTKY